MTYESGYSGEDLNRLLWESSADIARQKYVLANKADRALYRAGLDQLRLYSMGSGPNDAVPAEHVRFMLVPQSDAAALEDITQLFVRLPLRPNGKPTADVFMEAVRSTGESQRFLMTPDGARAYNDAGDIVDVFDDDAAEENRLFDVAATMETAAAAVEASSWPTFEQLNFILQVYDVQPQETANGTNDSIVA